MTQLKNQFDEILKNSRDDKSVIQFDNDVLSRKLNYANSKIADLEKVNLRLLYETEKKKQLIEQLEQEVNTQMNKTSLMQKEENRKAKKKKFLFNLFSCFCCVWNNN